MNKEQPEVTQIGMQGVTAETINAKIDQSVNKAVIHQAPKSNQPIPSNVRQGSKNFVGREEELEDIHAKLQEGQGVIEGMGGVGKTELALQYATQPNSISVKPSSIKVSQKKISSSILILSTRSSCSRVVTTSVNILPAIATISLQSINTLTTPKILLLSESLILHLQILSVRCDRNLL